MAVTLGAYCMGIVLVSVLGGTAPLAMALNHTRLQVYLSFSAGAMLGAAFFHMLPEAVRAGSAATIPWAAVGLLALFFLERFFSFHRHESQDHSGALPWGSAAFGLAVHSLVGGIALASAVATDFQVHEGWAAAGLGVFVATLVHKPADALTITTLMVRAGARRRTAHLMNLGFALMIPLGVVLFAFGLAGAAPSMVAAVTSAALAFSAGTFLCIALSDLLPELHFHSHDRFKLSVALLAGVALMAAAAAVEGPQS
jgi:zinc and cadmium transporter